MTRKRKPNIVLGNYWREKEHFADLYNAVLFRGKRVILPEDLEERDTESSHILEHRKAIQNISAMRDVVKIVKYSRKYGLELAILGIENQDKVHYAMPLRIMEYDAYSYRKQYEENVQRYQAEKDLTEDEFLSRMRRTDKFMPVITVVIYYGEREWDGAKCLKDMLAIPEEIDEYVNDYPIHLVEVKKGDFVFQNQENRDLFEICRILYDQSQSIEDRKKQVITYAAGNKVNNRVIAVAGAVVGKEITVKQKEENGMCTFFDELEKQCEERGKEIGKISIICKLLKKGKTSEQIADTLDEELDDIQKIYRIAERVSPEYDAEKIYHSLQQAR